jgi:hypothetical protein
MRVTLEAVNENAPVLRLPRRCQGKCASSEAMRYLIIENSAVRSSPRAFIGKTKEDEGKLTAAKQKVARLSL